MDEGEGEGGCIAISCKIIVSRSAEKLREGTVWCFTSFGYRKLLCLRVFVTIFCRKFFVSQYRKTSWGTLLCFRKFLVLKFFMDEEEGGGMEDHDFL